MRDWIARRLANLALRLGSKHYRDFVSGSINYGLNAAIRDNHAADDQGLRYKVGRLIWRRITKDHPDVESHWRYWEHEYLKIADEVVEMVLAHPSNPRHEGAFLPDPTHGRIDRDIQQAVDELNPTSLGQRVAMENTAQTRRDLRGGVS